MKQMQGRENHVPLRGSPYMMPDYEQYMKQLTQWLLSRETVNVASSEAEGNIEIRDSSVVI